MTLLLLKKGGQSSHGQKGKDNGQKGNGNIIDGVVNHLLSTGQSSHGQKGGVAYHGQKGGGATYCKKQTNRYNTNN